MRNTLILARRELQSYFVSPIAYVVMAAFLVSMGLMFSLVITDPRGTEASLRAVLGNVFCAMVLTITAPLLTMRLLAEEQRSGTMELLLTAPVRDWEVVVGKYLSALTVYAAVLLLTGVYPLILGWIGTPDPLPLLTAYLGLFLLGAALLAIGVFGSSLTQNQIVAAVVSFGIILVLLLLQFASTLLGPAAGQALVYLGVYSHFFDFLRGIVDTKDVLYYLSVVVGFLFLATRVLESRRWR